MKANDLVLLLVVGVLGYVLVMRLNTTSAALPGSPSTAPTGGTLPSTTTDIVSKITESITSLFNFGAAIAQSQPKTT